MSKGWFVELNDYMEKPINTARKGKRERQMEDVYGSEEYATTLAPNGKKYTAEVEINPIGIVYNKTLFAQAGITETPETFTTS